MSGNHGFLDTKLFILSQVRVQPLPPDCVAQNIQVQCGSDWRASAGGGGSLQVWEAECEKDCVMFTLSKFIKKQKLNYIEHRLVPKLEALFTISWLFLTYRIKSRLYGPTAEP